MSTIKKTPLAATTKPKAAADVDAWVGTRSTEPVEKVKRLVVELPADLHGKFKADCAVRGVTMMDVVRDMLKAKYS
jgi:hypothetical protein